MRVAKIEEAVRQRVQNVDIRDVAAGRAQTLRERDRVVEERIHVERNEIDGRQLSKQLVARVHWRNEMIARQAQLEQLSQI